MQARRTPDRRETGATAPPRHRPGSNTDNIKKRKGKNAVEISAWMEPRGLRSQALYPAELRARAGGKSSYGKGNPASTAPFELPCTRRRSICRSNLVKYIWITYRPDRGVAGPDRPHDASPVSHHASRIDEPLPIPVPLTNKQCRLSGPFTHWFLSSFHPPAPFRVTM